jgi:adenylate kinase family enzyme
MKPLQRYDIDYGCAYPHSDGDWVRDGDVKKLEKQNKIMLDAIKKAVSYPDDYYWRIINELLEKTLQEVEGEKE